VIEGWGLEPLTGLALQSLDRMSQTVWRAVLADTKESVLTVEIDATTRRLRC